MSMSIRSNRRYSTLSTDSSRLAPAIHEFRQRVSKDTLRRCSPMDIQRVMDEDWWLVSFLACYDFDVDITLAVVAECLKWRNSYQVEHIGMLSVKSSLDKKLMYMHGHDVERNPILWIRLYEHMNVWIRLSEHANGDRDTEKALVFWLERHFNESRAAPLAICIDMTHTTLINMDYNFFKFMLHALKFYYPNCAQDIIVFDSPSILNASWKIIKSWLDPCHPPIHLVTRDSIRQFIPKSNLPRHMGGDDQWEFTMDELARCIPSRTTHVEDIVYQNGHDKPDLDFPVKRSVKFESEDEDTAGRKAPLTIVQRRPSRGPSARRSSMPASLRPLVERRVHAAPTEWANNSFLAVSPSEELCLARIEEETTDLIDIVAIRNNGSANLLFKIKTTSPEKFRVRPSTGIVSPGATETVRVYLQSEYRQTAGKEKFLLMALQAHSTNTEDFAELWKNANDEDKAEHKLRCRVMGGESDESSTSSATRVERKNSQSQQIDALREQVSQLAASQKMLIVIILFLFIIQMMCMIHERAANSSLRAAIDGLARDE